MTARAAAVVPDALVDVFEHVPEYSGYDSPDFVQSCESDFRISLGRVIKSWGDQLLDLAERPDTPLSQADMHAIDVLLSAIGDLFDQLNRFRSTRVTPRERLRRESLRRADAAIIELMEETSLVMRELRAQRLGTRWLHDHADDLTDRLHSLTRRLRRRNEVLLDPRALASARPAGPRAGGRA